MSGGPRLRRRGACFVTAALAPALLLPRAGDAQITVRNLVVTAGSSVEGYQGNLPSAGAAVRDSTEFASAVAGEVGIRTDLAHPAGESGLFSLNVDGGMRQFAARGFELRDFAPREWVGTLTAGYARPVGERAAFTVTTRLRGRSVADRPPMPLFLQPGYRMGGASARLDVEGPRGVRYDVDVSAERSRFLAPEFAPQVRLLDREQAVVEAGATLSGGGTSRIRIFGAVEAGRYPEQKTFDEADPFRRDWTYQAGATWRNDGEHLVEVGLEGRANRSNSRRPEYDALTVRGVFSTSLPGDVSMTALGALTAKSYLHPTEFARLLPGEEANSASMAYLSLTRGLARNLDGTFRVGWTRAETEIGEEYFQRFGGSVLLRFRPGP